MVKETKRIMFSVLFCKRVFRVLGLSTSLINSFEWFSISYFFSRWQWWLLVGLETNVFVLDVRASWEKKWVGKRRIENVYPWFSLNT